MILKNAVSVYPERKKRAKWSFFAVHQVCNCCSFVMHGKIVGESFSPSFIQTPPNTHCQRELGVNQTMPEFLLPMTTVTDVLIVELTGLTLCLWCTSQCSLGWCALRFILAGKETFSKID